MLKDFRTFLSVLNESQLALLEDDNGPNKPIGGSGAATAGHGIVSEIQFHHTIREYQRRRRENPELSHEEVTGVMRNSSTQWGRAASVTGMKEKGESVATAHNARVEKAKATQSPVPEMSSEDTEHIHRAKVVGDAERKLGAAKVRRTMWDSHHAALDTLDHVNKHIGAIQIGKQHSPMWTGPDVTGEAAKKLTGVNTSADVIMHVRSHNTGKREKVAIDSGNTEDKGFVGASLKYSGDHLKRKQKIRQNGMQAQVDILQDHHRKVHGTDDHELAEAHRQYSAHPEQAEHEALLPHHNFLHHLFGLNAGRGEVVGHPHKFTKTGATKGAKYTENNGMRKINNVAESYLRGISEHEDIGPEHYKPIPHPTENRNMTHEEVKSKASEVLAAKANARPDPSRLRDAMVNSINKTVHGKSEGSKSRGMDDDGKRRRVAHSVVRTLLNANQPESKTSKAQHVLFVSTNSGRKKDNEARNNRVRPDTKIGSLDKALARHRKQHNSLPLSKSFVASAGEGTGGYKIGPKNGKALIDIGLDHRSGGSWIHQMDGDHLFDKKG